MTAASTVVTDSRHASVNTILHRFIIRNLPGNSQLTRTAISPDTAVNRNLKPASDALFRYTAPRRTASTRRALTTRSYSYPRNGAQEPSQRIQPPNPSPFPTAPPIERRSTRRPRSPNGDRWADRPSTASWILPERPAKVNKKMKNRVIAGPEVGGFVPQPPPGRDRRCLKSRDLRDLIGVAAVPVSSGWASAERERLTSGRDVGPFRGALGRHRCRQTLTCRRVLSNLSHPPQSRFTTSRFTDRKIPCLLRKHWPNPARPYPFRCSTSPVRTTACGAKSTRRSRTFAIRARSSTDRRVRGWRRRSPRTAASSTRSAARRAATPCCWP